MNLTTILRLPVIAFLCVCGISSEACTTFCFHNKDQLIFGKNFDFYMGDGQIIANKRSISKTSFPMPGEPTIQWTSKYGSITFNQIGREFPFGGMNEKGLVVEQMYLADTGYPETDNRAGLAELQWIQYQLDNSATVDEELATDAVVRVSKHSAPIHFLIFDAKGNTAALEYINGKLVVRKNGDLEVCALTNDTYNNSLDYYHSVKDTNMPTGSSSFERFAIAGKMLGNFDVSRPVDYAFGILSASAQPELTFWSIVYDVKNLTIHLQTRSNTNRRQLNLRTFDFACSSPVMFADIDTNLKSAGDFKPYSPSSNAEIIRRVFRILSTKPLFANLIPKEEEQRALATYPETTHCSRP
ncbi:linear amide C-N hydrolase [Chryseolinea sp. T2]|uniref:linear amide C-N hydrolase n=1 Tax=Chryseolinea sp. T2 TaxID=3129255 RepID=UPI003076BBCB